MVPISHIMPGEQRRGRWLHAYSRSDFLSDLIAGITVAIVLVPQGMAYALLAGLPPQMGLYGGMIGTLIYGLIGTNYAVSMGPTATLSILLAAGIGPLAVQGSPEYIELAITVTLMVGLIHLVIVVLGLGKLIRYINDAVISGFASAAALMIALSQLHHLMGISASDGSQPQELLLYAIDHISQTNTATLIIGIIGILILVYFKSSLGKHLNQIGIPTTLAVFFTKIGPLVVILLGMLIVGGFGLYNNNNVAIVGEIPAGLPHFSRPLIDLNIWGDLLVTAFTISIIAFLENIAIAKRLIGAGHTIRPQEESIALGVGNTAASLLSGLPINGSFSRSAINKATGAKTGVASVVTSGLIMLVLIFLTRYLYYFPTVMLAAIIVVAISGLIDWAAPLRIWRENRGNAVLWTATFVGVLFSGLALGVFIGVATGFGIYLFRATGMRLPARNINKLSIEEDHNS